MKFLIKSLAVFLILNSQFSILNCNAQELNVNVIVDGEQVQNMEKQIYTDMKQNITQFMNNRRWTNDKFSQGERIKMTIMIKLQTMPSTGVYTAITQVQVVRPVYGSGYETLMLNFLDKDFNFNYTMSQPIEFNDASYTSNLASLLSFYAYVALALDYDSFSRGGGNPYFEKALQTVNNAQSGGQAGWSQLDNNPNSRYWLMENLISPQFKDFREATYVYHRLGLDMLSQKPDEARAKILESLALLKKINDVRPNSCLLRTYFNTKDKEIIDVLMEATSAEKGKALELLKVMDPTNTDKYERLTKG